jgi:hypothetical protein
MLLVWLRCLVNVTRFSSEERAVASRSCIFQIAIGANGGEDV